MHILFDDNDLNKPRDTKLIIKGKIRCCPFCGGFDVSFKGYENAFMVKCNTCGARSGKVKNDDTRKGLAKAQKLWNKRK